MVPVRLGQSGSAATAKSEHGRIIIMFRLTFANLVVQEHAIGTDVLLRLRKEARFANN
jgi:hypothetical protein